MLVDSLNDVGKYPSVKVAPNGDVCISYYDATLGDLKYAVGVHSDKGLLLNDKRKQPAR